MDISRGTVIKSILWKLFERISVQGIQFLVTIVLARLLSPAEFGLITLITIFIILSNVIIEGGLSTALIQNKESNNVDFSTILWVNFIVSTILYILLYITAPLIASFYSEPLLVKVIRVLSITLFLYALNAVQMAYVAKNMLFKKLFIVSFTSSICAGVLGIAFALLQWGVWALVSYNISMSFFTTVMLWFVVKWRPRLVFDKFSFKKLFNYGWKVFVTNFIITLFVNIRSLIIGRMFTTSTLAVFDRGRQFPSLIVDNVNASIQAVMLPTFSNVQDDKQRVKILLSRSIKTSSLIIFPLLVLLFVMAKPLVLVLLTEKWIDVVPFIRIFCLAYIIYPVQITNMEVTKSLGHSDTLLRIEIIKKIFEVVILVISLFYGAYAIAWGVVAYNFICLFINLYPNSKFINYKIIEQIKDIAPTFIISIVMGLVAMVFLCFNISNFAIVALQLLVGTITYIALCYITKLESFMYLKNIFTKKFNKHII